MTNRKKKSKTKLGGDLLAGPLKSGLAERTTRRHAQRLMFINFEQLNAAFDEVLEQLKALGDTRGLNVEVAHLLLEAQSWIVSGVDRALTEDTSNEIEEARKLLELEHLLLDFTATPLNIETWTSTESWRRQSKFGFGELRKREELRQGLDDSMVIAARDFWITHSIHSHPKTLKDKSPPVIDQARSLYALLGDLLGHAISVVCAAKDYIESEDVELSPSFQEISTDATTVAWARMREVLHSHIPEDLLEVTRHPRPKTQVISHPIQYPVSDLGTGSELVP